MRDFEVISIHCPICWLKALVTVQSNVSLPLEKRTWIISPTSRESDFVRRLGITRVPTGMLFNGNLVQNFFRGEDYHLRFLEAAKS